MGLPLIKFVIRPSLESEINPLRVRIKDLKARYGDLEVIDNVSLSIKTDEIVSIIGPSGCGKSTLLNAIAGIQKNADIEGEIEVNAERVSYVFQEDTLLPWRTVFSNILLPYELLDIKPDVKRLKELIKIAGLKGFENYYPSRLSGGMRRRVDLIRAVAINPDLLLLDEPFGALDAYTRIKMQIFLYKLRKGFEDTTTILVTHDVEEALVLSKRVIVLSSRPARIVGELKSDGYENPVEARSTEEFIEKKKKILEMLYGGIR